MWSRCYADAGAGPEWNRELAAASLEGPFERGSRARVKFRTGLRLRFTLVEVEPARVFTDEAWLPGARMGHRHEIQPTEGGVRLVNTIYIDGPLPWLWSRVMGPRARRALPDAQWRIAKLSA